MQGLVEIHERFDLLQAVLPIISSSLPSNHDATHHEPLLIQDDITLLRSDIKSLPLKIQREDLDRVEDRNRLVAAFDEILAVFEGIALEQNELLSNSQGSIENPTTLFPGLNALRSLPTQATSTSARFLMSHTAIKASLEQLKKFEGVVRSVMQNVPGSWDIKTDLEYYTDAEINAIREADKFCMASSLLFNHLVASIAACQGNHLARLHLSGFQSGLVEMLLCKCRSQTWEPACFNPAIISNDDASSQYRICSHAMGAETLDRGIRFGESAIWDRITQSWDAGSCQLPKLKDLLRGINPGLETGSKSQSFQLKKRDRKLLGVFLAWSLFMLYGSPWLQHRWQDSVLVLPYPSSNSHIDGRRPLIPCVIKHTQDTEKRPTSEEIAALGILILELEANMQAGWTNDDEDFETGEKSNVCRLIRILSDENWTGELSDGYRQIAKSCLEFENLVEASRFPCGEADRRNLAMLYKRVVNPLFQLLVSSFGTAAQVFRSIPALSVPERQKKKSSRTNMVLFDDFEMSGDDTKVRYAQELWRNLEGFLDKVRSIRAVIPRRGHIGLAETSQQTQLPDRIRVAILDTGVDVKDIMIKGALGSRIKDRRSFVGPSPSNRIDTYGHGTHVARLLLKMAPAAEIYIAKISEGKNLDNSRMSSITEAIDYAVTEWKVDIISMSFGYYDQNNEVDEAIDRALKADKLLFAAASNEGGNRGRSRLAKRSGVICVHACDGKGNKGDMNPNPVKKDFNFSTLGVAVESRWENRTVYKSGTSFATPIAAGIAANILEFAGAHPSLIDMKRLKRHEGMRDVLGEMCTERDGYDYLHPQAWWADDRSPEDIAKDIQRIIE
ncbi:hypothetical protein NUW58_g6689 [Xylaria curta]|uniref:Uncharacterized protein n=1 Tax=Xylaria curta TaxID=42375 RepID=A0ACC1NRL4_9PEZI|nr:hypothetical protein NUW58_g6689 [Xylaria curta]